MPENRNERLAFDFHEMLKLQNRPYLSWIVTKGNPPYAEEYLLSLKLRTYALCTSHDRYVVGAINRCTVKVTLWDSYPHAAPNIRMLNIPPVFHPSWYSKGAYCSSIPWHAESSLKDYVKQMIGTLQYAPSLTKTVTPANYKALDWYLKNRDDRSLFPSDITELTENSPDEIAAAEKAATAFDEMIDSWKVR